jgi:tRNA(Ile2) C34 agmatinyltransferase TiaS
MEIICLRCNHKWDYKGKSEWYASCPKCRTTINVKKIKETTIIKEMKGGKNNEKSSSNY